MPEGSEELDPASHLVRGKGLIDQDQAADDLADRASCPVAIRDAPVIDGLAREAEEVRVMSDDDPLGGPGEFQMRLVPTSPQPSLRSRGYVGSMTAQCLSDRRIDVLVQVKPDPVSHGSGL